MAKDTKDLNVLQSPLEATSTEDLDRELKLLELEEKREARGKKLAKEAQRKAAGESIRANYVKEQLRTQADQAACIHQKPNGASAFCGQRDHSGRIHLICQTCSLSWHEGVSPNFAFRRPDPNIIGGPLQSV
jgi:hypothetical protein